MTLLTVYGIDILGVSDETCQHSDIVVVHTEYNDSIVQYITV